MWKSSGVEVPFIIDTPYARIDESHRKTLTIDYLPNISKQVIILSTNEEISSKHMAALSEKTSNVFLLEYGDDKCTRIIEDRYFEV